VCSLSHLKSDVSDFRQLKVPNSGKPEFGWERGGVRGFGLSERGNPLTPTLSPTGEREYTEIAAPGATRMMKLF
jgi:hypothetical protein